jgi:hypothetical protein
MHLAGFSHSMHNWVVCWNLPCSETCCWQSHKLCHWVHSTWIPVAICQKWSPLPSFLFDLVASTWVFIALWLFCCACMACIPSVCYLLSHGIAAECHSCRWSGLVLFFSFMDILVVLGSNWSSWLGSASTESVASFECCPALGFVVVTDGYPLIGCWYWEQSLSSL